MTWRHYLILSALGLIVLVGVAIFQSAPGYMDADYYYSGGLQLAGGHGFSEPYLWNYLDSPASIPHPSNAYWMPLASLLAAAGSAIFHSLSWTPSRLGFIAVATIIPPLTAALAWSFTRRRDLALASGLLAVFSGFYLPFLPVTDTFGLYMLFGGLFFLVLSHLSRSGPKDRDWLSFAGLGALAGLMHLTRADGLLWLVIALVAVFLFRNPDRSIRRSVYFVFPVIVGYFLVMVSWFVRDFRVFGSPLGPGSSRMLWLTSYDQLFAYPVDSLTLSAWWSSGLRNILAARLWASGVNLQRTLAEQGEIFLLPLIGIAAWYLRKDRRVQIALLAWIATLGAMSLAFPFAGARGGFFHSGAALQPMWWVLSPIGLERLLDWAQRHRGWNAVQASRVFQPALVVLAALLTVTIAVGRLDGENSWSRENTSYSLIYQAMVKQNLAVDDVVMVANPPGFFLASGNPSIAVPDGDVGAVLAVARRYNSSFLILEKDSTPAPLVALYQSPSLSPDLTYLGEVDSALIFMIHKADQ